MSITLGSDPEFMLKDDQGKLKSAIGIVPGKKDKKFDLGNGHSAFYDNVLAECNIRAENDQESVVESFRQCFLDYQKLVKPYNLVPTASALYPESECTHEDAFVFGCDPEFCAYRMEVIKPPDCTHTFRSGGGHLHIGYNGGADYKKPKNMDDDIYEESLFEIIWNRVWVVRMCDLFVGIPSVILDNDPTSKDRRKLYGKAGSHRGCPAYGVEYRSLGNFWLARPTLVKLIYDLASLAVKAVQEDHCHEDIWNEKINPDELKKTIDNADLNKVDQYMELIKYYGGDKVIDAIAREQQKNYQPNLNAWK